MNLINVKSHSTTKIIFSALLVVVLFLSTSCENFLNGSSLKNEIDSSISYANASYVNIQIYADTKATNIIVPPIGNYNDKYKQTDSVDLSFEPKEGWTFIRWCCEPEGAAEFTNANDLSCKAYIKTSIPTIKIYPKTALIPQVTETFPPMALDGVSQDTEISVVFNKPVNPEDFSNFSRIKILCDNVEIQNNFFDLPELSEDKKTLNIARKPGTFIFDSEETVSYKDIIVTFDLSDVTDAVPGENIPFAESFNFSYRINANYDKDAPVVVSPLLGARDFDSLNMGTTESLFHQGPYEEYAKAAEKALYIEKNHVRKNTVWFKTTLKDVGSGIKYIVVNEKDIYDTESKKNEYPQENKTYIYSSDDSVCKYNSEDNTYSFCFEYEIKYLGSGILNITADAYDYSGNKVALVSDADCFDLVYDTVPLEIFIRKNSIETVYGQSGQLEDFPVFVYLNTNLFLKDFAGTRYSNIKETENTYEAQILFSYDGVNWKRGVNEDKGLFDSPEVSYITKKLPAFMSTGKRDPDKDFYIKVVVKDDCGNITEKQHKLQKNLMVAATVATDSYIRILLEDSLEDTVCIFAKYESVDSNDLYYCSKDQHFNSGLYKDYLNIKVSKSNLQNLDKNCYLYALTIANPRNYGATTQYYDNDFVIKEELKANPFKVFTSSYKTGLKYYSVNDSENGINVYPNELYGSLSKSCKLSIEEKYSRLPDDAVPTKEQIVVVNNPIKLNSGYISYKMSYKDFQEKPGYTYKYMITTGLTLDNANCLFFTDKNDIRYSERNPRIFVFVYDENGNVGRCFTDTINCFPNNEIPDTIPPTVEGSQIFTIYPNYIKSVFKVNDSSPKRVSHLNKEIEYWFSNNEVLSENELLNLPSEKVQLNSDRTITIYTNSHSETNVYIRASDTSGNYTVLKYKLPPRLYTEFEVVKNTTESEQNLLTIKPPAGIKSWIGYYNFYNAVTGEQLYCKNSTGDSVELCLDGSIKGNESYLYTKQDTLAKCDTSNFNCNFLKISNRYTPASTVLPEAMLWVKYIYLPAINAEPPKCKLKNVISGEMGLTIFADNPVFVHTMYSPVKLNRNILDWECRGIEACNTEESESFTYQIQNVPKDSWYSTIVYFADGTTFQTEPALWKEN